MHIEEWRSSICSALAVCAPDAAYLLKTFRWTVRKRFKLRVREIAHNAIHTDGKIVFKQLTGKSLRIAGGILKPPGRLFGRRVEKNRPKIITGVVRKFKDKIQ